MHIEKFGNDSITVIQGWLSARGLRVQPVDEFPEVGFISYYRGEAVACAFIRRVEGGFAMLDGLVTNPDFPSDIRHNALDWLVEHLIKQAKSMKLNSLIATSQDKNTLLRAMKHGFVQLPLTCIALDLTKL